MRSHALQPRLRMMETLLSLIALGFIAWLVTPAMTLATSDVQHTVLSERVRSVRSALDFQRHSELVRTSRGGWPMSINSKWFAGEAMPAHPATDRGFTVEAVDGAIDEIAPRVKTFDPRDEGAYTLWYNRTNGAICARIPLGDNDERTLLAFNLANALGLETLEQTHTTP
jgi:hypothetical protein